MWVSGFVLPITIKLLPMMIFTFRAQFLFATSDSCDSGRISSAEGRDSLTCQRRELRRKVLSEHEASCGWTWRQAGPGEEGACLEEEGKTKPRDSRQSCA